MLLLVLLCGCDSKEVGIEESAIALDGIWYQYTSPEVVHANGKTFFGWIDTSGYAWVAEYVHATEQVTKFDLGYINIDDHSNPVIHVRQSDGRLIVFYSPHNDKTVRWRISTNPYSVASFGTAKVFTDATRNLNYPQILELSDEGRIYVFFRWAIPGGDNREWRYIYSEDDGETFGPSTPMQLRKNFASNPEGETYVINPYTKPVGNGVDRIDFLSSNYEQIGPDNDEPVPQNTPHHIYHWYYEDGAFYKSDGTFIKNAADGGLLDYDDPTTVDDSDHVNIWDIALDGDGNPILTYVKFVNYYTDHEYWYARWDGSQWLKYPIVGGDRPLPEAPTREWYSGGIHIDRADTSIVYIARDTGDTEKHFRIVAYHTPDGGQTWNELQQYGGEANEKNFRPVATVNPPAEDAKMFWIGGHYADLQDYGPCDLLMSDSARRPSSP